MKKDATEFAKKGWSYISWGAKYAKQKSDESGVTARVNHYSTAFKQKADQSGVSEKAKIASEKARIAARNAAEYTKESAKSVRQTAEEGKLQEKT